MIAVLLAGGGGAYVMQGQPSVPQQQVASARVTYDHQAAGLPVLQGPQTPAQPVEALFAGTRLPEPKIVSSVRRPASVFDEPTADQFVPDADQSLPLASKPAVPAPDLAEVVIYAASAPAPALPVTAETVATPTGLTDAQPPLVIEDRPASVDAPSPTAFAAAFVEEAPALASAPVVQVAPAAAPVIMPPALEAVAHAAPATVPQPQPAAAPTARQVEAAPVQQVKPRLAVAPATPNQSVTRPAITPAKAAPRAVPAPRQERAAAGQVAPGRYRLIENGVEFKIAANIRGIEAGKVSLRVANDGPISVRLGDLLSLVEADIEWSDFERLSSSKSADEYLTFQALRHAGIDVRYDAGGDRLVLGSPVDTGKSRLAGW